MAKVNLCDLCRNVFVKILPCILTLQFGKGKEKEVTKAEICNKCSDDLLSRINSDLDIINKSIPSKKPNKIIEISKGENIVKSVVDNLTPSPKIKIECSHDHNSFEENSIICKDCGLKWKA